MKPDETKIGKNANIGNFVDIGKNVIIGDNCVIKSEVKISDNTTIGANFICHQKCSNRFRWIFFSHSKRQKIS